MTVVVVVETGCTATVEDDGSDRLTIDPMLDVLTGVTKMVAVVLNNGETSWLMVVKTETVVALVPLQKHGVALTRARKKIKKMRNPIMETMGGTIDFACSRRWDRGDERRLTDREE